MKASEPSFLRPWAWSLGLHTLSACLWRRWWKWWKLEVQSSQRERFLEETIHYKVKTHSETCRKSCSFSHDRLWKFISFVGQTRFHHDLLQSCIPISRVSIPGFDCSGLRVRSCWLTVLRNSLCNRAAPELRALLKISSIIVGYTGSAVICVLPMSYFICFFKLSLLNASCSLVSLCIFVHHYFILFFVFSLNMMSIHFSSWEEGMQILFRRQCVSHGRAVCKFQHVEMLFHSKENHHSQTTKTTAPVPRVTLSKFPATFLWTPHLWHRMNHCIFLTNITVGTSD